MIFTALVPFVALAVLFILVYRCLRSRFALLLIWIMYVLGGLLVALTLSDPPTAADTLLLNLFGLGVVVWPFIWIFRRSFHGKRGVE